MDQIPGASLVLKGLESKKCIQIPFKGSATSDFIPKRFKISNIPKYNRTIDPPEYITTYTTIV